MWDIYYELSCCNDGKDCAWCLIACMNMIVYEWELKALYVNTTRWWLFLIQGCGLCGETVTSRLEDINHQLVLLTNILIGSSASSSRSSLERDGESSSTSHSSLETGGEHYNDEETYHAGSGHPSYLDLSAAFSRERSVMREILSAENPELPSPSSPPPADDDPPQSQGRRSSVCVMCDLD